MQQKQQIVKQQVPSTSVENKKTTSSIWSAQNLQVAPLNDAEGYKHDRQEQLYSMKKAWKTVTFTVAQQDNLLEVVNVHSMKDLVVEQFLETESTQAR